MKINNDLNNLFKAIKNIHYKFLMVYILWLFYLYFNFSKNIVFTYSMNGIEYKVLLDHIVLNLPDIIWYTLFIPFIVYAVIKLGIVITNRYKPSKMTTIDLLEKAINLNKCGITVCPLYGVDVFDWNREFRNKRQKKENVLKYDWNSALGIGIVAGWENVNDIKILKFGNFPDEKSCQYFSEEILSFLNLPKDYSWLIVSHNNRSIAIVVRFSAGFGHTVVWGTLKSMGQYNMQVHIESLVTIPNNFNIPNNTPETIDKKNVQELINILKVKNGITKDCNGDLKKI